MTHIKRIRDEVQAFHDGELPEARRAALAEHLARCSECTAERQRLQECDRLLADAWPEPVVFSPDSACDLLQRALAEAGARRREYRRQRARVAWRLAAAMFLLCMGSLGRIARQTSMPPEVSSRLSALRSRLGGNAARRLASNPPGREPSVERREPERGTSDLALGGRGSSFAERQVRHARAAPVWANRERQAPAPPNLMRTVKIATTRSLPGPADVIIEPAGEPGGPKIAAVKPRDNIDASAWEQDDTAPDEGIAPGVTEPQGELFVMVTARCPELKMTVRQASNGTPGYAQAAALHENDDGDLLWAQSTVSSDRPGPELVLLALSSTRSSP